MINDFLSADELKATGFKSTGDNVLVSRLAAFFNPGQISLGNNVRVDAFSLISASKHVNIGSFTHISAGCFIYGSAGCELGDFTFMSPRSAIFSTSDDLSGRSLIGPMVPEKFRVELVNAPVVLEDHAGLGTNSTALPGVTLREGAIAGAHALVTRDCDPWTIYGGAPAKPIKDRDRTCKDLGERCLAESAE